MNTIFPIAEDKKDKIEQYLEMIRQESAYQNLVGINTIDNMWEHHVNDSLQIASMLNQNEQITDIGSGQGFPGIVISIANNANVNLIEPRKLRANFLYNVAQHLNLNVQIIQQKVQNITLTQDVITARGFGSLKVLLASVHHLIQPLKIASNTRIITIKSIKNCDLEITDALNSSLTLLTHLQTFKKSKCTFSYSKSLNLKKNAYILEITHLKYLDTY